MGMSTHIDGIQESEKEFQKMKAIWDECEANGTKVPDDVDEFMANYDPSDHQDMEWRNDFKKSVTELPSECGFIVDLKSLPEDVRYLQFRNSW